MVLAGYLIVIAATLRDVSKTLGLVTFGVRAIDKQTEPIGPRLHDINQALEQAAGALEQAVGKEAPSHGGGPARGPDASGSDARGPDVPVRPGADGA